MGLPHGTACRGVVFDVCAKSHVECLTRAEKNDTEKTHNDYIRVSTSHGRGGSSQTSLSDATQQQNLQEHDGKILDGVKSVRECLREHGQVWKRVQIPVPSSKSLLLCKLTYKIHL